MDDTTKRELTPQNGHSGNNHLPPSTSPPPFFADDDQSRHTGSRSATPPLARPPLQPLIPLQAARFGDRTASGPLPSSAPSAAAMSTPSVVTRLPGDATVLTYASKLPPNHPGLQLDQPKARTLRKGPILTSVAILSVFVGAALVVALTPKGDPAQAAAPTLAETPSKDIELPDAVKDAPENNAPLPATPRLGPPVGGNQHPPPNVGTERVARDSLGKSVREERTKALSSPILVEMESPGGPEMAAPTVSSGPTPLLAELADPNSAPAAVRPSGSSPIADPNMQQHKNQFLARDGVNNVSYLAQPIEMPRSPFEVKAGTVIPTSLITGINSDLPGQIVGQVRENIYDTVTGNHLLIPQGSRLMATYDSAVTFGQSRVLVCWNRLIRPDGVSIGLECMPGVDLGGYSGFADEVDHHWWRIITGVALGTLVAATAQKSQGDVSGFNPSIPQLWASNAAGSVNQAGQAITQKNLAIQPTIKVRPGFSVNVLVTKDIVLVPYNR